VFIVRNILLGLCAVLTLSTVGLADEASRAAMFWSQMDSSKPDSTEWTDAQRQLTTLIENLPDGRKVAVAVAMMNRNASDATNQSAVAMFGKDPLPPEDIRALLTSQGRITDTKNSYPKARVLLKTVYQGLSPGSATAYSPDVRRTLVALLAQHVESLAQRDSVPYGERRLVAYLVPPVLCQAVGAPEPSPAVKSLRAAMRNYSTAHGPNDALAVAMDTWVKLPAVLSIRDTSQAIRALGHYDAKVRLAAENRLSRQIKTTPALGDTLLRLFDDPRDEVRSSAVIVFSLAPEYKPELVVPQLIKRLNEDRSGQVQASASRALVAQKTLPPATLGQLIASMTCTSAKKRPGPRRVHHLMMVASHLVERDTPASQKTALLALAMRHLDASPSGALHLLQALGPQARAAIERIETYRNTQANWQLRQYINSTVLPAIRVQP
jgi:hypothetical protein